MMVYYSPVITPLLLFGHISLVEVEIANHVFLLREPDGIFGDAFPSLVVRAGLDLVCLAEELLLALHLLRDFEYESANLSCVAGAVVAHEGYGVDEEDDVRNVGDG